MGRLILGSLQALVIKVDLSGGSLSGGRLFAEFKSSENLANVENHCQWLKAILKKLLHSE